ncbi:hypothetical protein ONE63_011056 [Megalurothrips usitatus]|uniref:Mif2/CENP-C cupin domain-containing protein n=1 Tax=Megalurothrips usitatus TaxID=439358 RepID=A0AAV7XIP5_9NEOP|nr:hypothetical protein ONE63_011056 [Megalurothrips usitatus]KAJ1524570.1 hypothetical protein ONE63_011056 [Megalurothrips usitatus]
MVFGGIGKKLSKKRMKSDLSISDPGSDDSWAALYKCPSQEESLTKLAPKKGLAQIAPAKVASPSPQKSLSSATTNAQEAIGDKRRRSESENSAVAKNEKPHAITSTPFVKHKKAPSFEVSSIISPIDITSDGHSEKSIANSTTLVVNRKNPGRPPDETFNQLLCPGKKCTNAAALPSDIQPLKSVINQADTTRQYAGGIVRGSKKNKFENLHKTFGESSWETAEEVTCTSGSKKTVSSQTHQTSKSLTKSAENDKGKIHDDSYTSNNAGSHNDKNGLHQAVSAVKSSQNSSGSDVRTDKLHCHPLSNESGHSEADMCAPIARSGVILVHDEKEATEIQIGVSQNNKGSEGEHHNQIHSEDTSNKNTLSVETKEGKSPKGDAKTVKLQRTNPKIRRAPRSKSISKSSEKGMQLLGRAGICLSNENKASNGERCGRTDVQIAISSESNKSCRRQKELEDGSCSNEKSDTVMPKKHENVNDLDIVSRHLSEAESKESPKKKAEKEFTEGAQQGNPLLAIHQQFGFAVQIGSICVKQTSSIGFSLSSQQTKAGEDHPKERGKLENCNTIYNGIGLVQNASGLENQDKNLAITSQQAFEGTSTLKKSSQDGPTVSKSPTDRPVEANGIILESSSEEERILLRSQSLRLRENQSIACRVSKISKKHDTGLLGIGAQRGCLKNLSFAGASYVQQKSPHKSSQEKPLETGINIQQSVPLSSAVTDNLQTSKAEAVKYSGVSYNTNRSSCEDLVFISRNPQEFNNSFENDNLQDINFDNDDFQDDNFELEIMSSSEDERQKKSQKPIPKSRGSANDVHLQRNNACNNSKLSKGQNLRLKNKEIRRRREKKINELLRSKRESSGSDTESGNPSEVMDTGVNSAQFTKEVFNVKQSQKFRKKYNGKTRVINGWKSGDCVEGPADELKTKAQQIVDFSPSEAPKATENVDAEVEELIREQDILASSHEPELVGVGEKEFHLQRNQLPEAVCQKAELPQRGKRHVQSAKIVSPSTAVNKDRGQNKVDVLDHNIPVKVKEVDASGPRCSRRKRHAPTMYWLGQRTRYKILDNGCLEAMDESLGTSRVLPASLNAQPHSIPDKNTKRKVERGSKLETKISKRIKQANQAKPKDNLMMAANGCRVFEGNVFSENDDQNLTCDLEEVKERKCVSGCGVKGDMVALGVGASFNKQMPSHYNQVYYVLVGEVSCKFADEEKTLVAGSFFIVPRGEVCHIKNKWNATVKLVVVSCTA